MNLRFSNQDFTLCPSGVLYWPAENLLVVSDLHLEKASHFAKLGFFLPPYDSHETLSRLLVECTALKPARLLVLGDTFHDAKGFDRLMKAERELFQSLLAFNPIWVQGNHDGEFVPPGFEAHEAYEKNGVVFRHAAEKNAHGEISGHYHPRADIVHKGARISRRCFIEDGNRLIMPAFGAYAGGLSVQDAAISGFFPQGYNLHLLGGERLYTLRAQAPEKAANR